MAKVTPKYEMEDFQLPDVGVGLFKIDRPVVIKERKDGLTGAAKPGWEYRIAFLQEGGGADGARHFESYFTKQNDGKDNVFGASLMFAMLIKVGIYKDDYDFDTDMLETDTFAKNWPKLEGKKVGIQIEHGKSKNNKVKSVAKKWLSVAEAKAEMAKKGTVGIKPEAVKAETDASVWGSEE